MHFCIGGFGAFPVSIEEWKSWKQEQV